MQLDLTTKEFRRLLDMVYIGNWVLNSTREDDRIKDYDEVERKIFANCHFNGMNELCQWSAEGFVPSQAFRNGGIHEAIMDYEDSAFFEILAEELSRRDMDYPEITQENYDELTSKMQDYMAEFFQNGVDHLFLDAFDANQ